MLQTAHRIIKLPLPVNRLVCFMGSGSSKSKAMSSSNVLHRVDVPTKKATLAMGCFWAPDTLFGATKGVIRTRVGYTGGTKENPTYKSLGNHTEAIDIDFDPTVISYEQLLSIFWNNHGASIPNTKQYSSFIYYHDDGQKAAAEESFKAEEANSKKKLLTKIEPASTFYEAEDYHQKYRLQQHHDIVGKLGLTSHAELVNSHVAARLNGYVAGHGGMKQFDEEVPKLGLPLDVETKVRALIKKNEGSGMVCG